MQKRREEKSSSLENEYELIACPHNSGVPRSEQLKAYTENRAYGPCNPTPNQLHLELKPRYRVRN